MTRRRNQIPHTRRSVLPRPRLMTLFSGITDFPLTVVKASAGYGKTTSLTHFVEQCRVPVHWLTLTEDERDPLSFVEHLLHTVFPGVHASPEWVRVMEAAHHPLTWTQSAGLTAEWAGTNLHEACIVVFDDFHVLDNDAAQLQWMDHWLPRLPWNVHVVLVTRTEPTLSHIDTLRLRGDVLFIRERELAFTVDEIRFLFQPGTGEGAPSLDVHQLEWLHACTRGMAMLLSMVWREWRVNGWGEHVESLFDTGSSIKSQIGPLFLSGLDHEHRHFLMQTSVLNALTAEVCDAVAEREDSAHLLRDCERNGYIMADPEGTSYSLHPLIRDHLVHQLAPTDKQALLQRAIRWHLDAGQVSRAVSYLFQLDDFADVERGLLQHIPDFLLRGQVSTVRGWLDRLPPNVIRQSPGLLVARGDVARHANRFAAALQDYRRAYEVAASRGDDRLAAEALLGSARLYLDTIQPSLAVNSIREARWHIHRADVDTRVAMLQVEFENAINLGKVRRARRLMKLLTAIDETHVPANNSDARLLLRTGHLAEAIRLLKSRVGAQENVQRTALSHREANLLLALLYSMTGNAAAAQEQALLGHSVGDSLQAPFTSAVGFIRLGHAYHLDHPLGDQALQAYQMAVQRMDEMDLPRGKSEALLGLCLAHGYRGQYVIARNCAEQGVHIAEQVGDVWMAHLVHLSLAQVACVNGQFQDALVHIRLCATAFRQCNDVFLYITTLLWRAIAQAGMGYDVAADETVSKLLPLVAQHQYEDLLLQSTLFGPKDVQQVVPLLQRHRYSGREREMAHELLCRLGCENLEGHPGYAVRVQTLGEFRAWRGFTEISRKEWQREKARQLFQFLLTHRGVHLHRDEITEQLWGDVPAEIAERDFKVALNVLSAALEPRKQTRGPTVLIERMGSTYALTAGNLLVVDKDVFVDAMNAANKAPPEQRRNLLRRALSFYKGDYLPEMKYEGWSEVERERLHVLYVRTVLDYSAACLEERMYAEVIRVCEELLQVDPVQEEAYVHVMYAYAALGNRPMVVQTFRHCERALEREFGVSLLPSTRELYHQLVQERSVFPRRAE